MPSSENFLCRQCGQCCHFEIPVTLLDIDTLAGWKNLSRKETFEAMVQPNASEKSGLFMIRKKSDNACIHLGEDNRCKIHEAKPLGCLLFQCDKAKVDDSLKQALLAKDEASRNEVWRQSIAMMITKAYIDRYGASWQEDAIKRAIEAIKQQAGCREHGCHVKLSRDENGAPLAIVYNCNQCEKRAENAHETIITLDDIERISAFLEINPARFWKVYLDKKLSKNAGVFRLVRKAHCIFFDEKKKVCVVEPVRPIHCRFTPCPIRTRESDIMDRLYLGSGSIEQQFRHQIALDKTRDYLTRQGRKFHKKAFEKALALIDVKAESKEGFERFCRMIQPYRYLDDTKLLLEVKRQ